MRTRPPLGEGSSPSDEALAGQLQAGDSAALRELMERYRRPLFGYLYRMVASTEDAEDLFQETFLRVIRHIGRYETRRRFRPWLYAIATNLVKNLYRSRSYRDAASLDRGDEDSGSLASQLAGRAVQPQDAASQEEARRIVQEAVQALPPKGRAAVVLFYFQGLSYEEVGAALEIPLGTVKSRIHNSMARLDKVLSRREEVL